MFCLKFYLLGGAPSFIVPFVSDLALINGLNSRLREAVSQVNCCEVKDPQISLDQNACKKHSR